MPTIRKKKLEAKQTLTADQRMHLLNGWAIEFFPFVDEEERRRLWFANRRELMSETERPYSRRISFRDLERRRLRPQGFYDYEVTEPRLILNDTKVIKETSGNVYWDKPPVEELEFDFLQRTGLVNDRDKELLEEIHQPEDVSIEELCNQLDKEEE